MHSVRSLLPHRAATLKQADHRSWPRRHRTALLVSAGVVLALAVAVLGAVGWVGSERTIHPAPAVEDHTLSEYPFAGVTEEVTFTSLDGTPLAGWFVPGQPGAPGVVLLHGFGRSRAELLPHAAYLNAAGYHVLLFDFRGRGQSGGSGTTMGAREPLDVRGAVAYLQSRPGVDAHRIAVQGVSLGASSGILAMAADPAIAAIVAESPFTTLRETVDRAFEHFIDLPSFPFAPLTVFIVEQRVNADADAIRPIDAIATIGQRPVFIIQDQADTEMPVRAGERLYAAAPGPKELWLVPDAGHADARKLFPDEYANRVLAFYREHFE